MTAVLIPGSAPDGGDDGEAGTPGTGGSGPRPDTVLGSTPEEPGDSAQGLGGMVLALVSAATDGTRRIVRPDAAVAVAQSFGFPLVLALLVLLFLIVQGRVDARDPKLRRAPQTQADTLVEFEDPR
jgi:hypothetical protein